MIGFRTAREKTERFCIRKPLALGYVNDEQPFTAWRLDGLGAVFPMLGHTMLYQCQVLAWRMITDKEIETVINGNDPKRI